MASPPSARCNSGEHAMSRNLPWIAVCILASCFPQMGRAQDDPEAKAAKFIEKIGGTLAREPKLKGNPIISVNLSAKKLADADLKELAGLSQLQTLDVGFTPITDAG